jgi:hypothetical protein
MNFMMEIKMKSKLLFYTAAIGFLLSLVAHFCTYLGINPQKQFPLVWILHLGIFVVFIPAVFHMKKHCNDNKKYSINNIDNFFKGMQFAPVWMKVLCVVFSIYAFFNFLIFVSLTSKGSPDMVNGKYALSDHGKIVQYINREEYDKYQSYEVRGFSGHWMIFYLFSATILCSKVNESSLENAKQILE